ncbi:MAG TPA: Nif3-like dinuclear metal center hexameric protein [Candidatus Lustribacter sp.]|nr:Nif3-like dinuclear metal center hexameric protein [Candidatus Lustribacter sp.]
MLEALASLYPPGSADDWDRVGLVTGDPADLVRRIHFAVDPTLAVIGEAVAAGADLLVTHHPLLLRGVHALPMTTAKGASVTALIRGKVALYVAHTNADKADPGVCDALAAACGLTEAQPLFTEHGFGVGRVGTLETGGGMTLRGFAARLTEALPKTVGGVRVCGPPDARVERVAVVGGAGDGFFDAVRASGADVYVTADLRHHPALEAREEARGGTPYLIDAGHWATESLWLPSARRELFRVLAERRGAATTVETYISGLRTEPWTFVLGANAAADAEED